MMFLDTAQHLRRNFPHLAQQWQDALGQQVLDSLKDYPYEGGYLSGDYKPRGASAELHLTGPRGKRDFTLAWHPFTQDPHEEELTIRNGVVR